MKLITYGTFLHMPLCVRPSMTSSLHIYKIFLIAIFNTFPMKIVPCCLSLCKILCGRRRYAHNEFQWRGTNKLYFIFLIFTHGVIFLLCVYIVLLRIVTIMLRLTTKEKIHRPYWCTGLIRHTANGCQQWPLLLTWFNFNPSMDK